MSATRILGGVDGKTPARAREGVVRVTGWCFEPGAADAPEIRLVAGGNILGATAHIRRPDVALFRAALRPPVACGFRIEGVLPFGVHNARLEARAVDRDWAPFQEFSIAAESVGASAGQPRPPVRLPSPPMRTFTPPPSTAARALNILIVLPGDFDSNQALHVVALTRNLKAAGHRFVVAADHRFNASSESPLSALASLGEVAFAACTHADAIARVPVFPDGRGPDIVHAWTTRDNVRKVCEPVLTATDALLVVHLEDNEAQILSSTLGRTIEELRNLPPAEAAAILPWNLSHPGVAERFLARAAGATLIIDSLAEFLPPGMPSLTFWPGADERCFFPRPRPEEFREVLGFDAAHTVLFYHGNTHAANAGEMRALYEAVAILNETGTPTTLVRTGENHCPFPGELAPRVASCVLELGRIKHHNRLPDLMAVADYFVQPGSPGPFNDYRFPSKLPEFFSIGRPVILPRTNLGSALMHGRDAFVLDRADAAGIAGAVRALRANPELAARLAIGATEFAAAHFNWSRSAGLLGAFYESIIASKAARL